MSKRPKIRTKMGLSKALHISRSTLDEYLSRPGAPSPTAKGYDVNRVVDFIAESATHEATAGKVADDLRALRAREISLRCERLKFRLEVERGEFVKITDLVSEISPSLSSFRDLLYAKCSQELPVALSGLAVPEGRIIGNRVAGELLLKMQSIFKAWKI